MDIVAIMDAIAAELTTGITGAAVFAWPVESAQPPALVVGYPERIEFDVTFVRGADRATFPVWYLVGRVADPHARDTLGAIVKDSTPGIKAALDGDLGGEALTARVASGAVETITLGGVGYLATRFDVEVYARGS